MSNTLIFLSPLFLLACGLAYFYQRRITLAISAAAFCYTSSAGMFAVWTSFGNWLAFTLWGATLGLSLCILLLYFIDLIWAPFCLELRYLTLLCWMLGPLAVVLNFAGLLLQYI